MANPQIPGGTLNRLLTSLQVLDLPQLNAVAGNFAPDSLMISFEGAPADYIANLTSATPSPRPYQIATITAHLLKSQPLSALWEAQRLTNVNIGDVVANTDSSVLPAYYLTNCIIENIESLNFSGTSNDFPLMIRGTYYINAQLFS